MRKFEEIMSIAKEVTVSGLPFMEGREKGETDMIINKTLTITDFGFMKDDKEEYAVFICKEDNDNFYFGGGVTTDCLKKLDNALTDDEMGQLLSEGLPVHFESKKSKNKREYTKCTFFPAE